MDVLCQCLCCVVHVSNAGPFPYQAGFMVFTLWTSDREYNSDLTYVLDDFVVVVFVVLAHTDFRKAYATCVIATFCCLCYPVLLKLHRNMFGIGLQMKCCNGIMKCYKITYSAIKQH